MGHRWFCISALAASALLLGGCPVTDDYFLLHSDGIDAGGSEQLGPGGAAAGGQSGDVAAAPACLPDSERCNGRDDDCDGAIDEAACTGGCTGFLLLDASDQGYMFCSGIANASFSDASRACETHALRLAWLDSATKNSAVAQKLKELGMANEVLFGASDRVSEGEWMWEGGAAFWEGGLLGTSVGEMFSAWTPGSPNNLSNEDCALLNVANGKWGDRSCDAVHPFVCEEPL
jgi:Lectin C-type domain